MNKKLWTFYAPVYQRIMRLESRPYLEMYARISKLVKDKEVLELAAGTGNLANHIAPNAKRVVATDYAEGMITQARKAKHPDNLEFQVADATKLPFADDSFDIVIIANALHLMPAPRQVLDEISRVLSPHGTLIAPNYVQGPAGKLSAAWFKILAVFGIKFQNQWTAEQYQSFLRQSGWQIETTALYKTRVPMLYVQCRKESSALH